MLYKFFFLQLLLLSAVKVAAQNDSITKNGSKKSNLYIAGQLFNANRSFEDLSSGQKFDSISSQNAINTRGIELGTFISLSSNLSLSVGLNYFSGGESWNYADSLSDSSFAYVNKYRQVALPIRLNIEYGNSFKWYGFIGVIPSSILNRRYESNFTNIEGQATENDVVTDQENINTFQFSGTVGTGLAYDFGNAKVFSHIDYRYYLTNTYTGLFLNHHQRLIGGTLGVSFTF